MLGKIFFFLIGFILMTIGFSYIIIYINLLTFGYSLSEFLIYIVSRYECYLVLIGLLIILLTLFRKGKKYDKRLRYRSKFIR